MKALDFGHKCNCNGKELRKTHYILGKDRKFISINKINLFQKNGTLYLNIDMIIHLKDLIIPRQIWIVLL